MWHLMRKLAIVALAVLSFFIVIGIIGSIVGGTEPEPTPQAAVDPTPIFDTPEPDFTPRPTATPTPVSPTPIPPTPEPTPEPQPIIVSGRGRVATDEVTIPFSIAILTIRHSGSRYFGVTSYKGEETELLANEVGTYFGEKWLQSGTYIFDVDADGNWEIVITPMKQHAEIAQRGFAGTGDRVSGWFHPPGTQAWEVSHSGQRYFGIVAYCAGGTELIANEVGAFSGSGMVRFPQGPCFFQVEADGNFSVNPR